MSKKFRALLLIVLIVVFIVSTVLMIRQLIDNKRSEDTNDRALDIALGLAEAEEALDPAEEAPAEIIEPETTWVPVPAEDDANIAKMEAINLDALRKYNDEIVGWIRIPGTDLDYAVTQGEDNEYYLSHAWDHTNSFSGAIFFESRSNTDLTDYNTIIYGHNMRNGSMFAPLTVYDEEYFLNKHPYVYVRTDAGVFRYEVFAAYNAPLDSPTYGLSFNQTMTKINFLNYALESSVIETGIVPPLTDRILTLSTCTNTGHISRWVVQARMKMMEVPVEEVPAEEVPAEEAK